MLTIEENDYANLLHSVHSDEFTIDKLKIFQNKYQTINLSKLTYAKTGDSLIHVCARLGRSDLLNYIFSNWNLNNVDINNYDGKTPLHEAAQFAQYEVIELLLRYNAQVNAIKRADWTPLMLACTKTGENALKIVKLLLEHGALPDLRNKDGWTALHLACREGDLNIVSVLLNDSERNLLVKTKNGRTVLHIAALHGHYEVVKMLLKFVDPNVTDNCGNKPLHEATFNRNNEIIEVLLLNGCDINSVNNIGLSCLHLAASEGLLDLIKYFVTKHNMDVNVRSLMNLTPLHCAARKKQREAMNLLTELGADMDIKDCYGRKPEDYFCL